MKRVLVVFHSRSGHTRRVARALASRLDADLDEIRTRQPRPGVVGMLRGALEALTGGAPPIQTPAHYPARHALVLVGLPVWVWSLPGPVRAWALGHPTGDARLAFFATQGRSGAERAFAQLQAAIGRAPEATLALSEAQLAAGPDALLDAFVAQLADARPSRPPRAAKGQGR